MGLIRHRGVRGISCLSDDSLLQSLSFNAHSMCDIKSSPALHVCQSSRPHSNCSSEDPPVLLAGHLQRPRRGGIVNNAMLFLIKFLSCTTAASSESSMYLLLLFRLFIPQPSQPRTIPEWYPLIISTRNSSHDTSTSSQIFPQNDIFQ